MIKAFYAYDSNDWDFLAEIFSFILIEAILVKLGAWTRFLPSPRRSLIEIRLLFKFIHRRKEPPPEPGSTSLMALLGKLYKGFGLDCLVCGSTGFIT